MKGLCKNIDECTGAAISGNCTNGLTCCIQDNQHSQPNITNNILTKEIFLNIVGNTTRNNFIYPYIIESLKLADIETPYQISAYLSQVIGETKYFKQLESVSIENDFNIAIGNNGSGDGIKYRGRGGILLKGKDNYERASSKKLSNFYIS